ncbi:Dhcr24 [Symbiodinium sp. CCMP2592]|nr:Dhcr24 [Symbiodinium sp. CCMP2592]
MQMPGIWRQMNLSAKVTLVIGAAALFLGTSVLVIGQMVIGNSAGSNDVLTNGIMVDGLRSFTLSPNVVNLSDTRTFWNMKFLMSDGTYGAASNCRAHLDSLNITHLETGSRDFLTSTCSGVAGFRPTLITYSGAYALYQLGDFRPYHDWGTYSVTSDFDTWVYDDTYMSDAEVGVVLVGGIVGSIGTCLCCIGCVLCCVSWCCCCLSAQSAQPAVVNGALPPMVAAEVAPQAPPSYQGREPVVVVMAQVVGQEGGNRNEQMA